MDYERADLEGMRYWDRPSVRVNIEVLYENEYGQRAPGIKHSTGHISPDGNRVWVTSSMGDRQLAMWISWDLLLEILNDPHTAPLHINQDDPVILEVYHLPR